MTAAVPVAVEIATAVASALGVIAQVVTPETLAQIQTLIRGERPDLLPPPPDEQETSIEAEGDAEITAKWPAVKGGDL